MPQGFMPQQGQNPLLGLMQLLQQSGQRPNPLTNIGPGGSDLAQYGQPPMGGNNIAEILPQLLQQIGGDMGNIADSAPDQFDRMGDQIQDRSHASMLDLLKGREEPAMDMGMRPGQALAGSGIGLILNMLDPKRKAGGEFAEGYMGAHREKKKAEFEKRRAKIDRDERIAEWELKMEAQKAERKYREADRLRTIQNNSRNRSEQIRQFDLKYADDQRREAASSTEKRRTNLEQRVRDFDTKTLKLKEIGGGNLRPDISKALKAEADAINKDIDASGIPGMPRPVPVFSETSAAEKNREIDNNRQADKEKYDRDQDKKKWNYDVERDRKADDFKLKEGIAKGWLNPDGSVRTDFKDRGEKGKAIATLDKDIVAARNKVRTLMESPMRFDPDAKKAAEEQRKHQNDLQEAITAEWLRVQDKRRLMGQNVPERFDYIKEKYPSLMSVMDAVTSVWREGKIGTGNDEVKAPAASGKSSSKGHDPVFRAEVNSLIARLKASSDPDKHKKIAAAQARYKAATGINP